MPLPVASASDIKSIYAASLQLAGIPHAVELVNVLLDPSKSIYFSFYIPIGKFDVFAENFMYYSSKQIDLVGVQADKSKINKPTRKKTIAEHYTDGFVPAF